jgi:ABC-2 type transport system permease protein
MNWTVLKAIFKRDFVSYFSNPTGYVFICVFVMLSSLAAFWPPDFFSNNLANLDQLNKWLPFILLVFIPAITMSIWAEERRQHTDELLLTLPATDVDVVLGKYLASVAIYTVALLFSMFSIYLVFSYGLGQPDGGLFLGTFVGYWFVGLAMLSIGMVASFLTSNLTVGFILGMIFNLPLALFGVADWIVKNPYLAQAIKRWSAAEQFADFQRGVISLGGISYFVMIAAVMLYLSMVLIGRRNWGGREQDESMWAHYLARTLGLVALAVGLNIFLSHHSGLWADITSEKLNQLSPRTAQLVKELSNNADVKTIKIDAYVSPQVPAEYAGHKLDLLSTLAELSALSGDKIQVDVHEIENFSKEATTAEQQYGIEPHPVSAINRGVRGTEEIFMGAAFTSGLDKVVIPFIDKGIPVEYELVRSICTVAGQKRKKLGVLKTDAELFGGFSMEGPTDESRIITELKKQYDVVEVDPSKPITQRCDVLLAVQPSSLTPEEMDYFVAAVKGGQPTAIFEDPFLYINSFGEIVGTAQPKRPPGGMMGMFGGGQTEPKGDISKLWQLLGVQFFGDQIIWQDFNPESKLSDIPREWIFIDEALASLGAAHPFNPDDEISSDMHQILLFMTGYWQPVKNSKLNFTRLAVTGTNTGTISYMELMRKLQTRGAPGQSDLDTGEPYVVAAHITGKITADDDLYLSSKDAKTAEATSDFGELSTTELAEVSRAADGKSDEAAKDAKSAEGDDALAGKEEEQTDINVVLVADVDWISPIIFQLREMGDSQDMLVDWQFQNVPFVLNTLDVLAGDDRFVSLRKRTRPHRILTRIEEETDKYRKTAIEEQSKLLEEAKQQSGAAEKEFRDKIAELEGREGLDPRVRERIIESERINQQRLRDVKISALQNDARKQIKQSERELAAQIRGVQDKYKFLAFFLPPIPPILLAFFVFFHRRKAEQEGVDTRRLRFGRVKQEQVKN